MEQPESSLPHSQVPAHLSRLTVQVRGFSCELHVTGYVFTVRSC